MDLNAFLDRKISKITLRKKHKRMRSKEQIFKSNIRQAIRLIKTGEYNENNKAHRILIVLANKHGFINRKDLTILKEI
jgi:hypothetical protein